MFIVNINKKGNLMNQKLAGGANGANFQQSSSKF